MSRAESWRYESNIYIKPPVNKPNIFANQQTVQMQPISPFSSSRYISDLEWVHTKPDCEKVQTSRELELLAADEEEATDAVGEGGGYSEVNSANNTRDSRQER